MRADTVVVTGGNGYVGARAAEAILRTRDDNDDDGDVVVLWVHAESADQARSKIDAIAPRFARYGARVAYAWGELAGEAPFDGIDARRVRAILHSAAVTRFNVDEETARVVNVEGSEKVFRFAATCPSLEQITHVSTVYAAGLQAGVLPEGPFAGADGFANHYERSKWQVEQLLAERYRHLPWRVARVATVLSEDASGTVVQQNAVHNTLKLLFYGLISLVPGCPETPLYFVTGDFVARALAALLRRSEAHAIYHVAHPRGASVTLDELVSIAFEVFSQDTAFRSRRVLRPLYADAESFDTLASGMDGFGGEALRQALASVAPFAKQLFVTKDLRNERLAARMSDYRAPEPRELVRAACGHLVRTRWGRERGSTTTHLRRT
jgi:thioester reductase-like protein